MTRFDPEEGVDYGVCVTCEISLKTPEDAQNHRSETFNGNRSHSTRAINPTREERIMRAVDHVIDDVMFTAMELLEELVSRDGATREEISDSLFWYSDFKDAWDK